MMKKFDITSKWAAALSTWITTLLVVISLIFVWIQIRDLRLSVENQTYQSVYETEFDLHKYFLDHPEYRPYFYDSKPVDKEGDERIKLETLAEWWCDFFDDVHQQRNTMPPRTFDKWRQFMKDIYQTSPILQAHIAKRGVRWYPGVFVEDIKCPTLEKCQ